MGCGGCELFPAPAEVVSSINAAAAAHGVHLDSRRLLKSMIVEGHANIASPGAGHRDALTTTNIYHYRDHLGKVVTVLHGKVVGRATVEAIKSAVTCYAAKLHLNRGASIIKPERTPKKGYADGIPHVLRGRFLALSREDCSVRRGGVNTKNSLSTPLFYVTHCVTIPRWCKNG